MIRWQIIWPPHLTFLATISRCAFFLVCGVLLKFSDALSVIAKIFVFDSATLCGVQRFNFQHRFPYEKSQKNQSKLEQTKKSLAISTNNVGAAFKYRAAEHLHGSDARQNNANNELIITTAKYQRFAERELKTKVIHFGWTTSMRAPHTRSSMLRSHLFARKLWASRWWSWNWSLKK